MNTAEYLIKKLEELGVNDFFGLPGDYNFNILYAVENNPNTKWIGCINELNAGYAADGYARIKGYGAVITTYGVGELSAINAIAGAYAENIPVISIVGIPSTKCIESRNLIHHNFQDVDYHAFENAFKSVTATTAFLNRDNAKIEIDRILKVLVKEKKPVYVAIPADIAKMDISDRDVDYDWSSDDEKLEEVVEKIITKINLAKKPVILGDILIKRFDARVEYKEFVAKSRIPVTNFLMGTNLVDMDYDKYVGGYFSKYLNPEAKNLLENTDCLIAVGTIYSDINAFGFNLPYEINNHIAIYGTYTYVDGIKYDNVKMTDVLENLTERISPREFFIEKPRIGYSPAEPKNIPLTSKYIYPRLQEFFKNNDIIFTETGILPQGVMPMKFQSNINLQFQTLWGSIGWATPAALGGSIASPNTRIILLTGEGSHQLTALEVGNMLRQGVKPIIIVLNNHGYTIERVLSDNPKDKFNDIVQMNYSKFARIFEGDVWSTKVTTEDEFDKALKVTQIMDKLCYIEICTEEMDMPQLVKDKFQEKNINQSKSLCQKQTFIDKTEKQIDKNKNEKITYETVVHKSLEMNE